MIKKVFPILAISIFICMLGSGIVVPLLPLYSESLGASGIWLGAIFAGFSISRTIFMPIFGKLSDRNGRKIFICIGLFFYAVITLGFLWANTVSQLVLVRFVHGISSAMILPIAQAYIGDVSPEGEEGRWMGYSNAAFFSGFGFGPLLGGVVTEYLGMDTAFLIMSGLGLLAFFIALFFLPEVSHRKQGAGPQLSFREIGRSSTLKGVFSFRFALTFGRSAFSTFLPLFAVAAIGMRPALIGVMLAIYMLLTSILGIPSGRLADRYNRKTLVVLGGVFSFADLAMIPIAHNFWQLLMLCAIGSIGSAVAITSATALVVEEGRKFGMGSTIALFNVSLSLGMVLGPVLGGAIVDFTSINSVFYAGAAMTLVGAGAFIWFTRSRGSKI